MSVHQVKTLGTAQIFDCGKADQQGLSTGYRRQTVDDDGNIVYEKLPQGVGIKIVDPAGNVGFLSVQNGASLRSMDDPYPNWVKHTKFSKGFVPYGKCPLREERFAQFVPKKMRDDRPCKEASDACGCKHVEAIIAKRQAAHRAKEEERQRAWNNSNSQQASELALRNQQQLAEVLRDLKK